MTVYLAPTPNNMNFLDKDFVILPGGSDIHPEIYGKENYKSRVGDHASDIDIQQLNTLNDAIKKGKPIFGINLHVPLYSDI